MGSPAEILEVLLSVTDGFDPVDVDGGVRLLLGGGFEGYDGRFLPTAPQLGRAIRQANAARADALARSAAPALPPPDIEKTDASRERVRAMVERLTGQAAKAMRAEGDDAEARAKAVMERTDARFDPPQDADAITSRLLRNRVNSGVVR